LLPVIFDCVCSQPLLPLLPRGQEHFTAESAIRQHQPAFLADTTVRASADYCLGEPLDDHAGAVLQGVTMVVQELCRQLPMIDFQNTAQLLAVGVPGAIASRETPSTLCWQALRAIHELHALFECNAKTVLELSVPLTLALIRNAGVQVASGPATGLAGAAGLANAPQPPGRSALLYDMHTGAPRLHLVTAHDLDSTSSGARHFVDCMECTVIKTTLARKSLASAHCSWVTADARHSDVSALAFDADGERLAALSVLPTPAQPSAAASMGRAASGSMESISGIVRVWALELGFTQRLQQLRGPVPIEPTVCKAVSAIVDQLDHAGLDDSG
jgi:hypothetical protein